MQERDSAARRLYELIAALGNHWNNVNGLKSAWQKVFKDLELPMKASEIQALLGSLITEVKRDALALDPNPPAQTTYIHFDEWAKVCFGTGFDPNNAKLDTINFISPSAHSHLLVIAALVERDLGAQAIDAASMEDIHQKAEDLLKDLRLNTTLPSDLRLRLVHAVTDVAESIRIYRVSGASGVDNATSSLISSVAVIPNAADTDSDGILTRLRAFAHYLVLVLRWGQAGAALLEGDVDQAIDKVIDSTS